MMNVTKAVWVCGECLQAFDMLDENDAQEWFYGHDCEAPVAHKIGIAPGVAKMRRGDHR